MDMEEMDLLELWKIIVKRKREIIVLFLLAVVIAGLVSKFMEPVYEASTTLILKSSKASSLAALDPLGTLVGGSSTNVTLQNYIYVLKSRTMLKHTLKEMGWETLTNNDLKEISEGLTVQQLPGTEILEIKYQSTDKDFAVQFVNSLSKVFIESTRDENRADLRTARLFLTDQIEIVEAQLKESEEKLKVFRESERVLQPMEDSKILLQQYGQWDNMLSEVKIAKIEAEQRLNQVQEKLLEQDEIIISSTSIQNNPLVQTYQQHLADLEVSLSGAKERYTSRHPEVLSLQAEIDEIRSKLTNEVQRVIGIETKTLNPIHSELYSQLISIQVELVALDAREQAITGLREQLDQKYTDIPAKELELVRLMRDVEVHENIYLMLLTQNEEIRINEEMHSGNLQMVDMAVIPETPIKPRVKLNIAIAGVLGLFIGFGLAFLLEFLDNTIKTKEQAEAVLGLPVIGQIPMFETSKTDKNSSLSSRSLRM